MKIILQISFIILVIAGILLAGDTAYTLENGHRQMGIFQPRIYGMNNNMELSTHPLLFFIKPNVKVKKYHGNYEGLGMASRFSFDYPTPLLKLIQREGKFGILSKDPDIGEIPHLLVLQGEFLGTKKFLNYTLSGKLGISICPGCDLDPRHIIDYDLAYPRMALYHYGVGANMGLDWDYRKSQKISMKMDLDILFLPEEHSFLEHKFLFYYSFSEKYTLSSGYKFSYGYYPFDEKNGLWNLFPIIDLSWRWGK